MDIHRRGMQNLLRFSQKGRCFITGLIILIISPLLTICYAQLLNMPESIIYDKSHNRYLVSNYATGDIVQIDSTGTQSYFVTGKNAIQGLEIVGNVVYVGAESRVRGFDLETGEMVMDVQVPGALNLNDVTADTSGNLYASEVFGTRIIKVNISNQTYSVFVDGQGIQNPNGIFYDQPYNRILVCSFRENSPIQAISLVDSTVTTLTTTNLTNCDGIIEDNYGNCYVTSWATRSIYQFDSTFSGAPKLIYSNSCGPADISYDVRHGALAIPLQLCDSWDLHPVAPSIGPYLGQTPPALIPERFPPLTLLSDGTWWWHSPLMFSPDGMEMYFVRYVSGEPWGDVEMYYLEIADGEWTAPQPPSFASDSIDNSPVFCEDGNKLLFTSNREGEVRIYQLSRTDSGWSEPELVNMDYQSLPGRLGWNFSLTRDETIYFAVWIDQNQYDIYRSELTEGQYSQFEKLPDQINSTYHDWGPYIDPDERYLIFTSNRPGGYGMHDLYISYKKPDETWSQSENMGININTTSEDAHPSVTPDGEYFFYLSTKSGDLGRNPYWVDAGFLCFWGDVDNSGEVNVADVIYLINYMFRGGPAPILSGDVNKDNKVDVGDVIYLINYLFRNGPTPGCI